MGVRLLGGELPLVRTKIGTALRHPRDWPITRHNQWMINDSVPWRAELARVAARLERRITQKRWSEKTSFLVERDLMVGMFTVRRLIEAEKTSSLLAQSRVHVRVCPLTGKEPSHWDRWSPWDHYDLDSRQRSELDVGTLLHEFVHSFVLRLDFEEDGRFTGIYVGSERTKKFRIYEVSIRELIDLFERVSREHLVWSAMQHHDGVRHSYRLSQHDLVDEGFAEYEDDQRYWHRRSAPLTETYLRSTFPAMDIRSLSAAER